MINVPHFLKLITRVSLLAAHSLWHIAQISGLKARDLSLSLHRCPCDHLVKPVDQVDEVVGVEDDVMGSAFT